MESVTEQQKGMVTDHSDLFHMRISEQCVLAAGEGKTNRPNVTTEQLDWYGQLSTLVVAFRNQQLKPSGKFRSGANLSDRQKVAQGYYASLPSVPGRYAYPNTFGTATPSLPSTITHGKPVGFSKRQRIDMSMCHSTRNYVLTVRL